MRRRSHEAPGGTPAHVGQVRFERLTVRCRRQQNRPQTSHCPPCAGENRASHSAQTNGMLTGVFSHAGTLKTANIGLLATREGAYSRTFQGEPNEKARAGRTLERLRSLWLPDTSRAE